MHKIKFYPVGNGDMTLIKLSNNKTIIIDCQIRNGDKDIDDITIYNVRQDLNKELQCTNEGFPYVDLFINTHPHKDHCLGFKENFYHGAYDKYDKKSNENQIIIDELWVSPMSTVNGLCDDAAEIGREVKRRRTLFNDNKSEKNSFGNKLRIIGYDEKQRFNEEYSYVPGTRISKYSSLVDIFIHAPFKEDVVRGRVEDDKNAVSIVMQISFRMEEKGEIVARVLMGGDSDFYVWEKVLEYTENHNNNDFLKYDILLAPHHCSWKFFNVDDNKDEVVESSISILKYKMENAHIVSSSKEIKDDDSNPPCYQAKKQYIRVVGNEFFKNTAVESGNKKAPKPIIYEISKNGKKLLKPLDSPTETIISNPTPRAGSYE